ncbi:DUF4382 domain-containing protein [Geothrix sp. PMB-07]|uniref:DUF4382 domain-containing protein n=1 Tax=Geothrix sp. PMB-07 TaxID=3068640 RepID=UPI002740BA5C|nr:DUF5666 domain-containing protein [Geothrix sp. PMB-07]WLT33561.1 DUF5666 domain-containing protein [Geothrix sp. PMB-07]
MPLNLPFARLLGIAVLVLMNACTGSHHGTHTLPPSTGNVALCFTGNGIDDWQGVDITLQSIELTPKGGGKPVALFTAPSPGLPINLALLDHTEQLVGNFSVPVGTYTDATLTIVGPTLGTPSAVEIDPSENPSVGFPGIASGSYDTSVSLLGLDSSTGRPLLTRTIPLQAPLVVTTDKGNLLDLAFDLSRPTFLVAHGTPGYNQWSLDLDGVLSQRLIGDVSQVILQPMWGTIPSIATDGSSMLLSQRIGAGIVGSVVIPQFLKIRPDVTNGTLFRDGSADTSRVVKDFSTLSSLLSTSQVVVSGRLQADGSIVAARVWTPGQVFGSLVDGHVIQLIPGQNVLVVEGTFGWTSNGGGFGGMSGEVDAQTQFFLRNPTKPEADAIPIGSGPSFLSSNRLAKGFRVFVSSGRSGKSFVIRTVEILAARFSGSPSMVTGTQFTCESQQFTYPEPYTGHYIVDLPFAKGFTWSNDLSKATDGVDFAGFASRSVDFGGTAGVFVPWTSTGAVWGDAANPNGWTAQTTEFQSLRLPDGSVASPWIAAAGGGSFGLSLPGGTQTITVDVSVATTKAYNNRGINPPPYGGFGIDTEPFDLSTASGLNSFQSYLARGWPIRVFGYPDGRGHITATTIFIQNPT